MKPSLLLWPATLLAGVGIGYFIPKVTPVSDGEIAPSVSTSGQRNLSRPALQESREVSHAFLDAITQDDSDALKSLLAEIPSGERAAHIDALLDTASPKGLSYSLKRAIRDLLKAEFSEDSEATLAWIFTKEKSGTRYYLFETLLDDGDAKKWCQENFDSLLAGALVLERPHEVLKELISTKKKLDPMAAVLLSKEHLKQADGSYDFPSGLNAEAITHGWNTAFEYYKDNWKAGNSKSGWSWGGEFPEGFNFSSFAESWQQHEVSIGADGSNGGFFKPPVKIWKEWAKSDPGEAFEFLTSGGSKTFELDDYFDGYTKSATPEEIFEFSKNVLADPPEMELDLGRELVDYLNGNQAVMSSFLKWGEEAENRQVVTQAISNLSAWQSCQSDLGANLFKILPEGERLPALREAITKTGRDGSIYIRVSDKESEFYHKILEPLGHSAAEIDAILAE